jgi:hypothetical protein
MKKIFILSVVLLLLFFSSINTMRAQLENCYPTNQNETCTDWTGSSFEFTYMSCNVHIDYYYRVCKDPTGCEGQPKVRIDARIFQIVWDWDNCLNLTQAIYPGYPNDFGTMNYVQFASLFNLASRQMGETSFINYYNSHPDEQISLQCYGTPPDCSDPDPNSCNFSVYYSNFSCEMICWHIKDAGTGWAGPGVIVNNYPCTSANSTCCEHIAHYCMCGDQVHSIISVNGTGLCNDAIPPYDSCFELEHYTTYSSNGCITICE